MYRDGTYYPLTLGGLPHSVAGGPMVPEFSHTSLCCEPDKGKRHYFEEESPMPEFC